MRSKGDYILEKLNEDSVFKVNRVIAYYPKLKELVKNTNACVLLSQIYYWRKKMKREFYKTDRDFRIELLMNAREFRTAKESLKKYIPFVSIVYKGTPRKTFYDLDIEIFESKVSVESKEKPLTKSKVDKFDSYKEYLQTSQWKTIAQKVRKRDGFKCVECDSKESLQVHHTTYENIFNENSHLDDLICVCNECHKEIHNIN